VRVHVCMCVCVQVRVCKEHLHRFLNEFNYYKITAYFKTL